MTKASPLLLFAILAGCVGPGMLTDGTSVSVGTTSNGALRNSSTLPFRGDGYVMPRRWQDRGRNHGTEELVTLLVRSARKVHIRHRGGVLGVADLSARGGGPTAEHRSHHSGRDVDLIFYATDLQRKVIVPKEMFHYDQTGMMVLPERKPSAAPAAPAAPSPTTSNTPTPATTNAPPEPPTPRRLDVARNWTFVKALVTDPQVPVQWIFVGRPISKMLLSHAKRRREPKYIVERAASVLRQPSDSNAHMDHYHVRVFCSLPDRRLGCVDTGPRRWFKKDIKYIEAPRPSPPLPPDLAMLMVRNLRLRGL